MLALAVLITLPACGASSQSRLSSPSPSPPMTQPLIAVSDTAVPGAYKVQLISLDGKVVAQAAADFSEAWSLVSAGGDHTVWVDRSGNLWELTAAGGTREIGRLPKTEYAGIDSRIWSFELSFDGRQWAWITEAEDWNHPWPANQYDPTVYSDVWIGGSGLTPKLVYHEVSNGFLFFYRWTAKGPLFYWHPNANLAMPFPATYGGVTLVDIASATIRPMTDGLLDIGADGTTASSTHQGENGSSIEFSRTGVTTLLDITGFYDCDVQLRPGAKTTIALVRLAERGSPGGVGRWPYRTWLVDVASGRILAEPIMDAVPVWRAWLPDGRVLLNGTGSREGLFIYSTDGTMRTILDRQVNVVGVLTAS